MVFNMDDTIRDTMEQFLTYRKCKKGSRSLYLIFIKDIIRIFVRSFKQVHAYILNSWNKSNFVSRNAQNAEHA